MGPYTRTAGTLLLLLPDTPCPSSAATATLCPSLCRFEEGFLRGETSRRGTHRGEAGTTPTPPWPDLPSHAPTTCYNAHNPESASYMEYGISGPWAVIMPNAPSVPLPMVWLQDRWALIGMGFPCLPALRFGLGFRGQDGGLGKPDLGARLTPNVGSRDPSRRMVTTPTSSPEESMPRLSFYSKAIGGGKLGEAKNLRWG
jgi:hypothetical protein